MKIQIENGERLSRLLEALADEFVTANSHFKLYCDLYDSIAGYETAMNYSTTFWRMTIQAHLDASLLGVCRIYDKHTKSASLYNLLETIKVSLSFFEKDRFNERLKDNPYVESLSQIDRRPDKRQLEEDMEFASARNPLVKRLLKRRNNLVAYKSADHLFRIKQEGDLSVSDLKTLLEIGHSILNRYSSLFAAIVTLDYPVGQPDYIFVLQSIQFRLDEERGKIEAEEAEILTRIQRDSGQPK